MPLLNTVVMAIFASRSRSMETLDRLDLMQFRQIRSLDHRSLDVMYGRTDRIDLLLPSLTVVSGAYLQYQTTHLLDSLYFNALDTTFVIDSPGNVTLTPGRRETFFCRQHDGAPVATAIQWYNPEGRLVSRNSGDNVYQFVVDHGRVTYLNFISYNHSLKGKYECRVYHVNEFMETLHLHIGEYCIHTSDNADGYLEIFLVHL